MAGWISDIFKPAPSMPLEERIRQRAYQLWLDAGSPDGHAEHYWRQAEAVETNGAEQPSLKGEIARQFEGELAEVQLLLDFISGRPEGGLVRRSVLPSPKVTSDGTAPADSKTTVDDEQITTQELKRIAEIQYPLPPGSTVQANPEDAALLIAVRNKLNKLVYPASGLTIAYTLSVWRPFFHARQRGRWALANRAFPSLLWGARLFKATAVLLTIGGAFALIMTTLLANAAQDGALKLKRVQALDQKLSERIAIIRQLESAEIASGKPPENRTMASRDFAVNLTYGDSGKLDVASCERLVLPDPLLVASHPLQWSDNALQHQVCDFRRLEIEIVAAQQALTNWWTTLCRVFRVRWYAPEFCPVLPPTGSGSSHTSVARDPVESAPNHVLTQAVERTTDQLKVQDHTEDLLLALTGVWLPMSYGFMGALVAALRSVYTKISNSTLAPWDTRLILTRVILGVMAGGCVGLFFAPSGTSVQGAPATLSLSAIAFLAGYAVDGLFSMLDQIIQRIFRLETEAPPRRA